MGRFFTEKETTAYHEAGHATVAFLKKVRLIKISIVPDESQQQLGALVYSNKLIEEDTSQLLLAKNFERLQNFICVAFGGLAAEYLYTGVKNIAAAAADLQYIENIAPLICPQEPDKTEMLTRLLDETIQSLQIADHWHILDKLAQHLIHQQPVLDGKEALVILKQYSLRLNNSELHKLHNSI